MALVHRKAKAGEAHSVVQPSESEAPTRTAEVIDLTELLKRSLKGKSSAKPDAKPDTPSDAGEPVKNPATKAAASRKKRSA